MTISEIIRKWLEKKNISIKISPAVTLFGVLTLQWGHLNKNFNNWSREDKDKIDNFLRKELKITLEQFKENWNTEIKQTNKEEIESVIKTIQNGKEDILAAISYISYTNEKILYEVEQLRHSLDTRGYATLPKQLRYSLDTRGYATLPKVSLRPVSQSKLIFLRVTGSLFSNEKRKEIDFSKISQIAKIVKKYYDKKYNFVIFAGLGILGKLSTDFHPNFKCAETSTFDVFKSPLRVNMTKIYNSFVKENIPVVLLFPSAEVVTKNGKIISGLDNLLNFISLGNIPLIIGDIVYDTEKGATILSPDALLNYSLKKIKPAKVIIATDIDGIFELHNNAKIIREITFETWKKWEEDYKKTIPDDITGGMLLRMKILIEIAKKDIDIFIVNGNYPERIEKILIGKNTICSHIQPIL